MKEYPVICLLDHGKSQWTRSDLPTRLNKIKRADAKWTFGRGPCWLFCKRSVIRDVFQPLCCCKCSASVTIICGSDTKVGSERRIFNELCQERSQATLLHAIPASTSLFGDECAQFTSNPEPPPSYNKTAVSSQRSTHTTGLKSEHHSAQKTFP